MAPRETGPDNQLRPAVTKRLRLASDPIISPPRLYLYFDAINRHGSIRRAAETLGIASSAINRRILDLEHELGTPLFERLRKGVRLTPAGEIFAIHVRRMLSEVTQASEQLLELQGPMRGHVAIGSAESAAIEILPPLIASFQSQYPEVRFTVEVGTPQEILANLLDDRVHLILTHEDPTDNGVSILASARKSFCALMRADHPLVERSRLMIHDCLSYPIVLAQTDLAARALVESVLANSAVRTQPVLVTNLFEVMKHYVRLTDAISFQFHLAALGVAPLDGVVAVPLGDPRLASASLTLAVHRGRMLPSSATAVCERLQTMLSRRHVR